MNATAHVTTIDRRKLTVVRAGRLFDRAGVIEDLVVVVDGHTIVAVDRAGQFGTTEPCDVVDLPGATLLPGLIDTHVHLCFDASADVVGHLAVRNDDAALAAMADAARISLRCGVTTVRDLGDRGYLALQLRDRHDPALPTIVAAGPPITSVGGHCHYLGGEVSGLDGVRVAVREHAERDVDVIKITASGSHLTLGTLPDLPQFSAAELHAAVAEARRYGLPVTARVDGVAAIEAALAAGVDGLERVTFQTADGVAETRQTLLHAIAKSGVAVGLTLGIAPVPDHPIPPFIATTCRRCWPTPAGSSRPAHPSCWAPMPASPRSNHTTSCRWRSGSWPASASVRRRCASPPRMPPRSSGSDIERAGSHPDTTRTSSQSTATRLRT